MSCFHFVAKKIAGAALSISRSAFQARSNRSLPIKINAILPRLRAMFTAVEMLGKNKEEDQPRSSSGRSFTERVVSVVP